MHDPALEPALVRRTLALMFGDMLAPLAAARKRLGTEATIFMFSHMGRDLEIDSETLVALWAAELDQPVDHGFIELFMAMRDRLQSSPLLQWRLARAAKKAGFHKMVGQARYFA